MAMTAMRVPTASTTVAQSSEPLSWTGSRPLRIGFVMEQNVGHVTWYQNLRGAVDSLAEVDARWIETRLFEEDGLLERFPGIPPLIRSGARGLIDLRRGLRGWQPDVLLFNTQKVAMFCQWDLARTPTMLMTDVTPIQYDRLASLYDHTPDRNPVLRLVKHRANMMNFRLAKALIPSSTWARDSMIDDYGVPPERVHVIPIGTDTTRWRRPRSAVSTSGCRSCSLVATFSERAVDCYSTSFARWRSATGRICIS